MGPNNDAYIKDATSLENAAVVIAAWGNGGGESNRSEEVLALINRDVDCLKVLVTGNPQHPLYVRGDVKPVSWRKR